MSEINTHDFVVSIFDDYLAVWVARMQEKVEQSEADTTFLVRNKDFKKRLLDWAIKVGRTDVKAKIKRNL